MPFHLDRRAVLLTGLGVVLAGCASRTGAGGPPAPVSSQATPDGPAPAAVAPVEPGSVPTREEIVDRFSGRHPVYWGLEPPQATTVLAGPAAGIALTLDFCGGPEGEGVDHRLFEHLRERSIPATLFLNARWIDANPGVAEELAADPLFELANHGTGHLPLSVTSQQAYGIVGTTGVGEVYDEIMTNDAVLTDLTGVRPRFFRSGTAHLDDVAAQICHALGVIPAGFRINADAGATYPASTVAAETSAAVAGDIIIAHGNRPEAGTAAGLAEALTRLSGQGNTFVRLSEAIPA